MTCENGLGTPIDVVGERGLEPPRGCPHRNLNPGHRYFPGPARIPIGPLSRHFPIASDVWCPPVPARISSASSIRSSRFGAGVASPHELRPLLLREALLRLRT